MKVFPTHQNHAHNIFSVVLADNMTKSKLQTLIKELLKVFDADVVRFVEGAVVRDWITSGCPGVYIINLEFL